MKAAQRAPPTAPTPCARRTCGRCRSQCRGDGQRIDVPPWIRAPLPWPSRQPRRGRGTCRTPAAAAACACGQRRRMRRRLEQQASGG
eukprot:363597-Chlamydomonas_euryale.AAC.1